MSSPDRLQNDRKLVAHILRLVAEQIETSHIDGFNLSWTLGDEVLRSELQRLKKPDSNVISLPSKDGG
jgi:hypothetical protein